MLDGPSNFAGLSHIPQTSFLPSKDLLSVTEKVVSLSFPKLLVQESRQWQ
jgi:hypothetical protein